MFPIVFFASRPGGKNANEHCPVFTRKEHDEVILDRITDMKSQLKSST
jgi:hypothetical protein